MSDSTLLRSPYCAVLKPGVKGPKPSLYFGVSENETTEVVRPWKFEVKTINLLLAVFDAAFFVAIKAGEFDCGFDGFDAAVFAKGFVAVVAEAETKLRHKLAEVAEKFGAHVGEDDVGNNRAVALLQGVYDRADDLGMVMSRDWRRCTQRGSQGSCGHRQCRARRLRCDE